MNHAIRIILIYILAYSAGYLIGSADGHTPQYIVGIVCSATAGFIIGNIISKYR